MGLVHENITLKNSCDVINALRGIIGESQIRQLKTKAMVDTGAGTIIINEEIRQELGLEILRDKKVRLANESPVVCKVTEPIEIHWKNRSTVTPALVLEGAGEVLLGAIPLEDMDLIVDPVNQRLVGAHGDEEIHRV